MTVYVYIYVKYVKFKSCTFYGKNLYKFTEKMTYILGQNTHIFTYSF